MDKFYCNCMGQEGIVERLETFRNLVWEPKENDNLGDVAVDGREYSNALQGSQEYAGVGWINAAYDGDQ
jgi:hypothetical protein